MLPLALTAAVAAAAAGSADRPTPRAGFVTYAGWPHDRGIGQVQYEAFVGAVRRLGLKGRVVEVPPVHNPKDALMALARQRYDLIVDAAPEDDPSSLLQAARAFPKAKFLVDAPL